MSTMHSIRLGVDSWKEYFFEVEIYEFIFLGFFLWTEKTHTYNVHSIE